MKEMEYLILYDEGEPTIESLYQFCKRYSTIPVHPKLTEFFTDDKLIELIEYIKRHIKEDVKMIKNGEMSQWFHRFIYIYQKKMLSLDSCYSKSRRKDVSWNFDLVEESIYNTIIQEAIMIYHICKIKRNGFSDDYIKWNENEIELDEIEKKYDEGFYAFDEDNFLRFDYDDVNCNDEFCKFELRDECLYQIHKFNTYKEFTFLVDYLLE